MFACHWLWHRSQNHVYSTANVQNCLAAHIVWFWSPDKMVDIYPACVWFMFISHLTIFKRGIMPFSMSVFMLSLTKAHYHLTKCIRNGTRRWKGRERKKLTVEPKLIDICLDPASNRRLIVVNTIDLVVCLDAFVGLVVFFFFSLWHAACSVCGWQIDQVKEM